jgi:hypothetical protein
MIRRDRKFTAEFWLTLEKLAVEYVAFSIVGDNNKDDAVTFLGASGDIAHPRRVQYDQVPIRYLERGKATIYNCNSNGCSIPIIEPANVERHTSLFVRPSAI